MTHLEERLKELEEDVTLLKYIVVKLAPCLAKPTPFDYASMPKDIRETLKKFSESK